MGKVKYSEEMKKQTVKYILEGGQSSTKAAKELGIDKNTVCRWVREYRTIHWRSIADIRSIILEFNEKEKIH